MSSPFKQYTVTFEPSERIYEEGERAASMFIVQSGSVRLVRQGPDGPVELGVMEKGDFFGEMAILEGGRRGQTAEAVERSEIIEINAATFDAMIRRNLEIAIRMLRKLSSRLRRAEEALETRSEASSPAAEAPAPPPPPTVMAPPPPSPPAAPGPPGPAAAAAAATRTAAAAARLISDDGEVEFLLEGDEALVGRYDPVTEIEPEVDLTELDLKRSVSRRHARILRREGGFVVVEEVGALNGTFLNGKKLVTGKPTPMADGDHLSLGMVRMVFRCA